MKKICLIIICLLFIVGCGSTMNFNEEREIKKKTIYEDETIYSIGEDGKNWCNSITADEDFAEVGDIIKCVDGKIIVIKRD